ncbi:YvrJ family protein [Inediibacterium massiliense]|uniref:YvrJ family protein n=1 Tax=Inediibacterium massiliense TaxID=1658111 RepID=UPI0006B5E65F|nr:YvrJ family protein [Inediibacterium massiliense]
MPICQYELMNKKGGLVMEELMSIIANVGFPIGVSVYLLVRIEGKIDDLSKSIKELDHTIENLWNSL